MIISINGYEFPAADKSTTEKVTGLTTRTTANGTLIAKKGWEKWETNQEFKSISIEQQTKFYEFVMLGMTEPLSIVARDSQTDAIVSYQGMTTDAGSAPKTEYWSETLRWYSGASATFREV